MSLPQASRSSQAMEQGGPEESTTTTTTTTGEERDAKWEMRSARCDEWDGFLACPSTQLEQRSTDFDL